MLSYLLDLMRKRRTYARFAEWPMEKRQQEVEVVSRLLVSMASQGECPYENIRLGDDPPDIVADSHDGSLCGFEVTELVDGQLAAKRERESGPPRSWQAGQIAEEVSRILVRKDSKPFKGGPYSQRLVCIFTGEPGITRFDLDRELELLKVPPLGQLTGAFVLLRFDPQLGYCPYVRLRIAG